ncbi:MAG: hypothetical protein ACRDRV_16365 [Pseudonocardiaceae bacterium]
MVNNRFPAVSVTTRPGAAAVAELTKYIDAYAVTGDGADAGLGW